MKIALSNSFTRRKPSVRDAVNRVDGDRLSRGEPKVIRRAHALDKKKVSERSLVRKLDSARNDLTPEDAADAAQILEHEEGPEVETKIVSTSGDVIYNPATQTTQFSASRAVKTNLERRMPGTTIRVADIGGDGLVSLSLAITYEVGEQVVSLQAKGLASPTDMTIVQAIVSTSGGKVLDIDPIDQARSPEETARFLKRLATNCALGE